MKTWHKCVSKMQIRQTRWGGGVQLNLCVTPRPPFQRQQFRRSLQVFIYSTQEIENDVSARLPNTTSASCDLDIWPSVPEVDRSCPYAGGGGDLCKFALKSVHSFSKYIVHMLITDKRTDRRTDERTKGQVENIMRPATLCRLAYG